MDVDDTFSVESAASVTSRLDRDLGNPLLNFTTTPEELELQNVKRHKASRDPMSHRIIEKRRRDRMNNCLADLSRLIPTSYLKQGQGRIEKTEIIEMAIRHLKNLQAQVDGKSQTHTQTMTSQAGSEVKTGELLCCRRRFYLGFKECQEELLSYLVEGEGLLAADPFCSRIIDYLNAAGQRFKAIQSCAVDDKCEVQMELEGQRITSLPFHGGPSASSQNNLEPLMPLLPNPVSTGMMIPVSPVRDKHLRNLLASRALQQMEAECDGATQTVGKSSCTGDVTLQSSPMVVSVVATSSVTSPSPTFGRRDFGIERPLTCGVGSSEGSMNGGHSSGYLSENSGFDKLSSISSSLDPSAMMAVKDVQAMNVYKFKHNITKRFSQEGKVISPYDSSSSGSSRDLEDEQQSGCHSVKHRIIKGKSRHASSSDSGPYPTSECSSGCISGGSRSSSSCGLESVREQNRTKRCKGNTDSNSVSDFVGSGDDCCSRSAVPLPGFVLHPSGTHYMPMSVCHANIPDMFDAGMEAAPGTPVFHPISIPVHFRGPVISVPNIHICTGFHSGENCLVSKVMDGGNLPKDCKDFKCSRTMPPQ